MKKAFLIILSLCFLCTLLHGQNISLRLFVSDSMNRHDTIEFGFDYSATMGVDNILGEQDMYSLDWDSLDMRVIERDSLSHHCLHNSHWGYTPYGAELYYEYNRDYKIDYRPISGEFGTVNMNFEIMIKALDPPIYITTDFSGLLASPYEGWSVLHLLDEDCLTLETENMISSESIDTIYISNDTLVTLVAEFQHEVSVEDIESQNIQIYPNPAQTKITIASDEQIVMVIYDVYGKQILKSERTQINIEDLENGLYLVRVYNKAGDLLKTEKLIKDNAW